MRILLVAICSLCLISGIAVAKPEIEKPVPPFNSPLLATEVEPNNDYTTANTLTVGDAMDATLDPAGDLDYFAITVAAGDIIAFETFPGADPAAGDTQLDLWDTDGVTFLAFDDDGGGGLYSLINYTFATAGTYFISVNHYSATGTGSYVLTATLEDPPPPAPDNDVCTGAIDLQEQGLAVFDVDLADGGYTNAEPMGSGGCTSYSANGPDAFYKIYLNQGDSFTATEDGACDMSLYLFTDCADPFASCLIGSDNCCSGAQESVTWTAEADGWYYLGVDAYSSSGCLVTVTIADPVGSDNANWGSIKSMFR